MPQPRIHFHPRRKLPRGVQYRNGRFVIRYWLNGKKKSEAFPTIEDAVKAKQARETDIARGNLGFLPADRSVPSFKEFAENVYMENYVKPSPRYDRWLHTEQWRFKKLVSTFGEHRLSAITVTMIEAYRKKALVEGHSGQGANRDLRLLKAILNRAVYEKVIHENPIKGVRCSAKVEASRPRVLSPSELTRLDGVLSDDVKELVHVLLSTGLREFEALSIQWRDIRASLLEVRGEISKNGKRRYLPLVGEAETILKNILARKKKMLKTGTERVFDHLVANPLGGRTGLENRLREAFKKANIHGKGLGFHIFRHTFATRLIQKGVDVKTVQELLGHSDLKMVLVYTHTSEQLKKEAISRLTE